MKQTFRTLLLLLILSISNNAKAQSPVGTWILDSVQVVETISGSIKSKTVLPNDDSKFKEGWMKQLTLGNNRRASYTTAGGHTVSNISYSIKSNNEGDITLYFMEGTAYRTVKIQQLSENTILIPQAFKTKHEEEDINISWKMYYHKSNK